MSAADDLTELVERAAAAARAALAAKWTPRADVDAVRRVRPAVDEQRDVERRSTMPAVQSVRRPGGTARRRNRRRRNSHRLRSVGARSGFPAPEATCTGARAPDPVGASVREPKQ